MFQMFFSKKSPDYTSFSLPRNNNRPKVVNQVLPNNQRFSVACGPEPPQTSSSHFNEMNLPHGSVPEINSQSFSSCAYIIPRQQIKTHTVIGEGEFGVVHKGIWTNEFGHSVSQLYSYFVVCMEKEEFYRLLASTYSCVDKVC